MVLSSRFSDLDLVLDAGKKIDWDRLDSLKDTFAESDLAMMIDIHDWNAISESFREIIDRKSVIIQAGN